MLIGYTPASLQVHNYQRHFAMVRLLQHVRIIFAFHTMWYDAVSALGIQCAEGGMPPRAENASQILKKKLPLFLIKSMSSTRGGGRLVQKLWMMTALESLLIHDKVPGAVLELGIFEGATSEAIRWMMDRHDKSQRDFHVYDSFAGLPAPSVAEEVAYSRERIRTGRLEETGRPPRVQGLVNTTDAPLVQRFQRHKLVLPIIHRGFFGDIAAAEYPDPVAFAFFDGDLYSSIHDSFMRVWDKLSPGGQVFIHDFMRVGKWPGPYQATHDFLKDRNASIECYGWLGHVTKLPLPQGGELGEPKVKLINIPVGV